MATSAGPTKAIIAPAFLNECQLAERVRTLVKEDVMSKQRIAVSLAAIIVVTLLVGIASVRAFPLKAGSDQPGATNPNKTVPEIFKVGNGVTAPIPTYKPEPPYTKDARDAKLKGNVILKIVVGANGTVTDIQVIEGLGKGLTESAVKTVKTWKFEPATKNGRPVAVWVTVEVTFKLY